MSNRKSLEEKMYHLVCKEIQKQKEELFEFELMIDETDPWELGFEKEKYEKLKNVVKSRIDHLNETSENWQKEILKEYGIFKQNVE